jgi:5-formyltetrahydrofolate cyclo-ligase
MSPAHHPDSTIKSVLRSECLARRRALTRDERKQDDALILTHLLALRPIELARAVFIYISVQQEVDSRRLIAHLLKAGKSIFIPRIASGAMTAIPFTTWSDLTLGALGIPTPPASAVDPSPSLPEVAIVPGLCFSEQRHRLGYGGGYYDRWLSLHAATTSIGVFRDIDLMPNLPVEAHDISLDLIVTPSRVLGGSPE